MERLPCQETLSYLVLILRTGTLYIWNWKSDILLEEMKHIRAVTTISPSILFYLTEEPNSADLHLHLREITDQSTLSSLVQQI
ncbi:hypothetical protein SIIN_8102_T [Serendipita indica DSM 11827]|nr:hypothetical protein SIIN_8102_T [Serendipita indica DSM 11827]